MNLKLAIIYLMLLFSPILLLGNNSLDSLEFEVRELQSNLESFQTIQETELLKSKYIRELANNSIKHSENLIKVAQLMITFIGFLITAFGIISFIELKKIREIRKRIEDEVKNLQIDKNQALYEINELRKSFLNEGEELLKVLFYITEGDHNKDSGRYEDAIVYYNQALSIKSNNPEVYSKLGKLYREMGDFGKAVTYFSEGLKFEQDNVEIINSIARTYRKSGQLEKAEEYYNKAISIDDDYVWSLSGLSMVHIIKGNYRQAEALLNRLLLIDNFYLSILNLGIVYEGLGDKEKAKAHYKKALRMINARILNSSGNRVHSAYRIIVLAGLSRYSDAQKMISELKEQISQPLASDSIRSRLKALSKVRRSDKVIELIKML